MGNRLRVASIQYYIRPVKNYQKFADQVSALVGTAATHGTNGLAKVQRFKRSSRATWRSRKRNWAPASRRSDRRPRRTTCWPS